jgi:hypothetical protein
MKNKQSNKLKAKRITDFKKKYDFTRNVLFRYDPWWQKQTSAQKKNFLNKNTNQIDVADAFEHLMCKLSGGRLKITDKDGQDADGAGPIEIKSSDIGQYQNIGRRYKMGKCVNNYGRSKTRSEGYIQGLRTPQEKTLKNADLCVGVHNAITGDFMYYFMKKKVWQEMTNNSGSIFFSMRLDDTNCIPRIEKYRVRNLKALIEAACTGRAEYVNQ